jgi:hypothetical protein
MKTTVNFAVALGVLALAAPSVAETSIRVRPAHPSVTQDVVASFVVRHPLKRGYHYNALLLGMACDTGSHFVGRTITKRPRKGRRLSIRFKSTQDPLAATTSQWCPGEFTISVTSVRNDGKRSRVAALGSVRFRAR